MCTINDNDMYGYWEMECNRENVLWFLDYFLPFYKVWLNESWFVIHNKALNFHDWILCYHDLFHDKIKKSIEISKDLWCLNNMKVILTLWTLNYVDCLPFSCIDSFHVLHNQVSDSCIWLYRLIFELWCV